MSVSWHVFCCIYFENMIRDLMKTRLLLFVSVTILLTACPRCPETILLDNGPLPDEAMQYIPYRNGQSVMFRHSHNMEVRFDVYQVKYQQTTSCAECCKYNIRYETNRTDLKPNYPLFNISLEISNIDTSFFYSYANVGSSAFSIPTNGPDQPDAERLDSALVDSVWYYDVYKLGTSGGYQGEEVIYADTIFYNYTDGIIKIIMSNKEYYELVKK